MKKVSGASVAMIMAIALYFTLLWGYDALRVFTSPTYGLEDVWRSQYVFGVGAYFSLSPMGLMKLAAFFGALKLAVAAACALHIADRLRTIAGGQANNDVLEGGMMLVVAVCLAAAGPATWSQNSELVREQVLQLVLAAIAIALCLVETNRVRRAAGPRNVSVPRVELFVPQR